MNPLSVVTRTRHALWFHASKRTRLLLFDRLSNGSSCSLPRRIWGRLRCWDTDSSRRHAPVDLRERPGHSYGDRGHRAEHNPRAGPARERKPKGDRHRRTSFPHAESAGSGLRSSGAGRDSSSAVSREMRGSHRSSHAGIHQFHRPIRRMAAGTRTVRTTVASMNTAAASPTPISLNGTTRLAAKATNTVTITMAAEVI